MAPPCSDLIENGVAYEQVKFQVLETSKIDRNISKRSRKRESLEAARPKKQVRETLTSPNNGPPCSPSSDSNLTQVAYTQGATSSTAVKIRNKPHKSLVQKPRSTRQRSPHISTDHKSSHRLPSSPHIACSIDPVSSLPSLNSLHSLDRVHSPPSSSPQLPIVSLPHSVTEVSEASELDEASSTGTDDQLECYDGVEASLGGELVLAGSIIPVIPTHLTQKSKKVIILDMDETLIHTQWDLSSCDFTINIQDTEFCVAKRPGLQKFLQFCSNHFEKVLLWTASRQLYADKILDQIDPEGLYFTERLYDTHCRLGGKRLSTLDLDPADVIFVDDQPGHFVVNLHDEEVVAHHSGYTIPRPKFYANQYLISPFDGDSQDNALYKAMEDFYVLKYTPDVRETFLKSHACAIMEFLSATRGFNFDRWSHVYKTY